MPHGILAHRLEQWQATPDARLIVMLPPRHGKSELVSRRLPAWLLGSNPDCAVMVSAYAAALANRLNRDVQRVIEHPTYGGIFPATHLAHKGRADAVRTTDLFEVVGRRGSLRSAGVGGSITGMGFDYGIIDDPCKDREQAESPTMRDKVWEWYTSTFYTRRAPGARILLTLTRWHEDDLAGRLLEQAARNPKADQWEVLRLPAVAEGVLDPFDPRADGEALWPERYPLEDLARVRAQSEYDWWSLYQQDPRQAAGAEWPVSHFGEHIWFSDWPQHLFLRAVSVDASKGAADNHGDYCAITALGYDGSHVWAEAWLERLASEQVVERTLDVCATFNPDVVAVEANLFQSLYLVLMEQRARERMIAFPGLAVENMVPKPVRIRRLGPRLANRTLHVRATPGGRLLVDQLRQFPLAAHDDGPDSLEMGVRAMVELWNGKHKRR